MTISWTSSSLSVLGPRSRSQWLFLEEQCQRSSALINYPISILLHTSIGYDYTSNKLAFQHDRVKVAVTVLENFATESLSGFNGKKILLVHLFL